MRRYYSNGKLLITGEYAVLDGALALAVPTRFGQSLEVNTTEGKSIHWQSLDHIGNVWLDVNFDLQGSSIIFSEKSSPQDELTRNLQKILNTAAKINPYTLSGKGREVISKMDFPRNWGLGSSSTLINNIAQWFDIDAFDLLEQTFGGSGYDIAAARNNQPITYQLTGRNRSILTADFNPSFKDLLFFVHLNRKQNSRDSIAHYKGQSPQNLSEAVEKVSALTSSFIQCESIDEFQLLLEIHETLISRLINTPKLKASLFPDYPGAVKSLGGWGGDFILATGGEAEKDYFRSKGYNTILAYSEMIRE